MFIGLSWRKKKNCGRQVNWFELCVFVYFGGVFLILGFGKVLVEIDDFWWQVIFLYLLLRGM